jgi:pimeloyl-ACP methyl ester carboxylesterase
MPITLVNGVRLYYELHGDGGEPLVFVHGYTGDHTDWEYQIPDFSRDYQVLVMDLRGHGRSEAPKDRDVYTIEAMAADVEALVDKLGLARYHLVGHSMGGGVVEEMALHNPERLLSLTLEDTGPILTVPGNTQMEEFNLKAIEIAETEGMAAIVAQRKEVSLSRAFSLPVPPDLEQKANQRLAQMSVDGFIGATLTGGRWKGIIDRASGILAPTLIIYGALDVQPIVLASQWLSQLIAQTQVVEIPDAGHSPQWEQPDLYNRALRRHLEANRP